MTVADNTFDARISKEYPGYRGRLGPTKFPPQDADMADFLPGFSY